MKKPFYFGIGFIVCVIFMLLIYGVYLNRRSEDQITDRMAGNRLLLQGTPAKLMELYPHVELSLININSSEMTDVTALIDGRIVQELVSKNSHVEPGTPIITLSNETIALKIKQADSDILEAEALLARAKNNYGRYERLVARDAVPKERFEEAVAELKSAEAKLLNATAQREQLLVEDSRKTITSPVSGEILKFYRQPGAYVTAGTPVALIGNFGKLYFTASIEDEMSKRFSAGQVLKVTFNPAEDFEKAYGSKNTGANQGSHEIFSATVLDISPSTDEPAKTRQVSFEVDNSTGLLEPGFYSAVSLALEFPQKCLAVPIESMIDDKNRSLFVVENGILKRREVVTGATDGKYIEIVSGLKPGEIVITSETSGLTDGMQVDVNVDEGSKQH